MKIFVCGATGFVGRHLVRALRAEGHAVVRAVRKPSEPGDIAVDFRHDDRLEVWLQRVRGFDVVVNAVGLLRDSRDNPMQKLHAETPCALFSACAEAGVARVVQLSALGVDSGVSVPYFTTRLVAEAALRALPQETRWLCLRPSVIYGEDGASARMFRRLAQLPVQVLPMGGTQALQPVHIGDICRAVVHWLADEHAGSEVVEAVGGETTTMRGMLDSYREQMGCRPALHIALPPWAVGLMASLGDMIPPSPLCSDTYAMMEAGNAASSAAFAKLLHRAPRSYRDFLAGKRA